MNNFIVSPEVFNKLKSRWEKFKDEGFRCADPMTIPLCELFNLIPGVVTVFSCEGHLTDIPKVNTISPYIMLACGSIEGLNNINTLWDNVYQKLTDKQYRFIYKLRMSIVYRVYPGRYSKTFYPVIIFSYDIQRGKTFTEEKLTFISTLKEVAYEMILNKQI